MAEKTIVDKAGMAVGFGIAAASDAAGAIKTAIGSAVTTVTEVLKKAPPKKAVTRKAAKKVAKKATAKKSPAKKAAKKTQAKKAAKKSAKSL
jgi:hypothetical protein